MFNRIVFLPSPPLLDPAVASGAAGELDQLREVVDRVVAEAVAATEDVAILGSVQSRTIGLYLLNQSAPGVNPGCLDVDVRLTEPSESTALFVMGDGTAKRAEKAPGYVDNRALGFDDEVAAILRGADLGSLAGLDRELGQDLWAAGVAPWLEVGAWAAESKASFELQEFHFEDPYGVAYFVASFRRIS